MWFSGSKLCDPPSVELLRPVGWVPVWPLEGSRGKAEGRNLLQVALGPPVPSTLIPCCGALYGLCICLGQSILSSAGRVLLFLENTHCSHLPYAWGQQQVKYAF